MTIYTGSGVAIVTPFFEDGSVDYDTFGELIEFQIAEGTYAIIVAGTTGESSTMPDDEQVAVIDFAIKKVAGRIPVIAGSGVNDTAHSIRLSKEIEKLGPDALLVVTPYYIKTSQQGLIEHFEAIADSVDLPIVLYNVPGRTGINMKAETTVKLAKDFSNIVAIKEASGSLEQVDEIIKNKPDNFDVISGDDALTFSMIASGAAGVISVIGNALPKEFSRMIRLEFNGEYEPARKIHHMFTELYSLLFVDGNPAGCKALLNDMGMIENVLRLPLVPTTITTKQKMADILKELRI